MTAYHPSIPPIPSLLSSLTSWWRCFVFSRLQPALVTRFDLTYPGVTAANYLASLWFYLNVSFFLVVLLSLWWSICDEEHYTSMLWHRHVILQRVWNNRLLNLQTEPPFEENPFVQWNHICFGNIVGVNQINLCVVLLFDPGDVCFLVNMLFKVIVAILLICLGA